MQQDGNGVLVVNTVVASLCISDPLACSLTEGLKPFLLMWYFIIIESLAYLVMVTCCNWEKFHVEGSIQKELTGT